MTTTTSQLKDVLHYLHDSVKGLTECAEHTSSVSLKGSLLKTAMERKTFISELNSVLSTLQEKPVESGTLAGPLHRVFIDLKSYITAQNNEEIKNEILRGDKTLIKAYNDALATQPAANLKEILSTQLNTIHQELVNITNLASSEHN